MSETLPIFGVPQNETLADRCNRLAAQVYDYETDISNKALLDLTAIRTALEEAANALAQANV